jgi:hypothetical protein
VLALRSVCGSRGAPSDADACFSRKAQLQR